VNVPAPVPDSSRLAAFSLNDVAALGPGRGLGLGLGRGGGRDRTETAAR